MSFTLYAVRSRDGKWYRSTGYGGGGKRWVDDPAQAAFYASPGGARRVVAYWAKHFPQYGVPDIVWVQASVQSVESGADYLAGKKPRPSAEERRKRRELREAERRVAALKQELQKGKT